MIALKFKYPTPCILYSTPCNLSTKPIKNITNPKIPIETAIIVNNHFQKLESEFGHLESLIFLVTF